MSKCTFNFFKGMGIGVMVGGIIGTVGACCVKKSRKGFRNCAGKALHSIGDLVENVTDMF